MFVSSVVVVNDFDPIRSVLEFGASRTAMMWLPGLEAGFSSPDTGTWEIVVDAEVADPKLSENDRALSGSET